MTELNLKAIERRVAALEAHAEWGEWRWDEGDSVHVFPPNEMASLVATVWGEAGSDEERAIGEFVAAARQDIPALLGEVKRLRSLLSATVRAACNVDGGEPR